VHRKRETPTPRNSARSNDHADAPIAARPGSGEGDEVLLALEREFEVLAREIAILMRTAAPQDEKRKHVYGSDAAPVNSGHGGFKLARADDGTDGPTAQLEHVEAALARLEPIERAIMTIPAYTVVGLGVKARHAAYVISEYWDEPLEKADWHRRAVRLMNHPHLNRQFAFVLRSTG
jgi:hypothetical protein